MRGWLGWATLALVGCGTEEPPPDLHALAGGCYTVHDGRVALVSAEAGVSWGEEGTPLRLQYSDLATTLLYDPAGGYVVGEAGALARQTTLESDMTRVDDAFVSSAEWLVEAHPRDPSAYALRGRRSERWLSRDGLTDSPRQAAKLRFEPAEGCATYPELSVDAEGAPGRTTWDDGELYGYVDMHSHILTNFGFAGGMFHGAPFHRLGVTHALMDCAVVHGEAGRKDFFGYAFDSSGDNGDLGELLPSMLQGELPEDNHATAGYPDFTEWPDSRKRSTHQTQYHRWLERSWLSGLRLVVLHATSNAVNCHIAVGEGWSPSRYDCEDMTAAARQVQGAYEMERYLDAQAGGPGLGWFRIVTSPAQAREVIAAGKMAVILGFEVSDLFECNLTPRPGGPVCDEAHVDAQLDLWHERGVRVIFPNHKYDNAFSPGDGSGGVIEAGNFLNSGYFTNKVTDCPTDVPTVFDKGEVTFGGLLEPREVYQSEPHADLSELPTSPVDTILPHALKLLDPPIAGDFCQNAGLTPIGEHLLRGIVSRGMLPELDHLPRRSYKRAFEILQELDYPALGTHGNTNHDRLYALGGLSSSGFGRCHDPAQPGSSFGGFQARLDAKAAAGMHVSQGFGFDYNGFAHGPRPRFGPEGCSSEQVNPITYPFTSYDGAVTFTQPTAGNRVFDFNTEGMAHIGLIPEYIEDVRRDGVTDAQLEPLFRSAEGYIRMWERAEARAAALRGE
jgi:microsomal dipeptidase-like Zn-dependent dipeptidase